MDQASSDWHRVARESDLKEGDPKSVAVGGHQIALFRIGDAVYAMEDLCTHEYALLSEGYVEGDVIECPLHQARFHIPSGKVMSPPADEDVKTYPVRIEGGEVLVGMPRK